MSDETMMGLEPDDLETVSQEYLQASEELASACGLAGDDSIKQDMIAFIQPQFLEMCAKAEGIRVLTDKGYAENKGFILQEMRDVTKLNLDMVRQIKAKLGQL